MQNEYYRHIFQFKMTIECYYSAHKFVAAYTWNMKFENFAAFRAAALF